MNSKSLLFFTLLVAANANAQVANGNFSSGGSSWAWKKAVFEQDLWTNCNNTAYTAFSPALSGDTPSIGTTPASGRVARLNQYETYNSGTWILCRQIEQTVSVPLNKQLKFDIKFGSSISGPVSYTFAPMEVMILVINPSSGTETVVYAETDYGGTCTPGVNCPVFVSKAIGMAQYGGKTVKLIVRGSTYFRRSASGSLVTSPTSAHIDNIRLE